MTRPRKLLVGAIPENSVDFSKRFSKDRWDYINIQKWYNRIDRN